MLSRAERVAAEIAHGRRLLERHPAIWTWRTAAGGRRAARRAELLVAAGRFHAGQRLLEIGCGIGVLTARVAAASRADVRATDVSPDLVAEARRRHPELSFDVADAHALPFEPGAFDGVFGSSTLHHLELDAALAEVLRVLRPGGRVAFAEPNLLNPIVLAQKSLPSLKRRALDLPHETAFVRSDLAARLRRAGFVEVRVRPFDFLHPLTPEALVPAVAWSGRIMENVPLMREIAGSLLVAARRPETGAVFATIETGAETVVPC